VIIVFHTPGASDIRLSRLSIAIIAMAEDLLAGEACVVDQKQLVITFSTLDATVDWFAILTVLNLTADAGVVAGIEIILTSHAPHKILPLNLAVGAVGNSLGAAQAG